MSTEENKAVVVCHHKDILEQGHVELIDGNWAPDGSVPGMNTPQQWKELVQWWHKAAPGFKITILDMVAEGNKVAAYWQADVTYSVPPTLLPDEPFIPLGKPVSWRGMSLFCIRDGKIVSEQNLIGWTDMLIESGAFTLQKKT
jgi:predicted ester cyclase